MEIEMIMMFLSVDETRRVMKFPLKAIESLLSFVSGVNSINPHQNVIIRFKLFTQLFRTQHLLKV